MAKEAPAVPVLDLTNLAESKEAKITAAEVNVPQEVKDFVKTAHNYWKETPKKWREVSLGSEAAVQEATKLARKFAKSVGLTFRVKVQGDATKLVYKVTDKFQHNGTQEAASNE